ncbi:MAG: Fe-S cluster assembly ATPase SufC [Rhodospirillaceae bacterium]|jgi:Fe-S cluster assembly ATP-binding protein|nr:Fe-S cluster assembly ATPase SufC [Rhodospirillaceae bacterium]MBT5240077.1 Fe-S cluster assembly ATPase SufC [Rhodospirillaceae bacterium]MBT5564760.1 Fe-S cluster assembly ATPase SufC [Rhodospirillaceae bacterium]MBT6088768.1 Fe-S cluster assembly ATPase SufC [Rhodospirillaceae bacterium]MBT6962153.1 Fe-S cluster assembly ATPase SufC [Rhodospirillaceae bacterium]
MSLIEIKDLHVSVDGKEILKGIDLNMDGGEIHAIMGPNGTGKSTLSYVLAGKDGYEITQGSVLFDGKNLLDMEADERARAGVFLAFQYPMEIPGVATATFLKTALNAKRREQGLDEIDAMDFLNLIKSKTKELEIPYEMIKRPLNVGFSGGEKKRAEVLQMSLLEPRFAILDETDSGLDIDALKVVSDGVNALRSPDRAFLIITHYQRLLSYIVPDHVHVLVGGRIVESGDKTLAELLEAEGYARFEESEAA